MDSREESRQESVVPTPNRASLRQLAVLFLRLGLTALVAINAGLLLGFRVNSAWLVLGGAVMSLTISALGNGGRRRKIASAP